MHKPLALITILLALVSVKANASLIANGSFENTNKTFVGDGNLVDELSSGSTTIPGWTTINGVPTAWIQNGNPYGISASDGSYFLDLTGYSNVGTYGGVSQSFATVAGSSYVVTFDLGYGGNSTAFGGPVSVLVSAGGSSGTFTSASGSPNPAVWDPETFAFTATGSSSTLSLIGKSTAGGFYIGLDNVDVELGTATTTSSSVPEPGTYTLLLTGMSFLGCAARRRLCR
jgi:hypothetical protein